MSDANVTKIDRRATVAVRRVAAPKVLVGRVVVPVVLLALFGVLSFGQISSERSAERGLQTRFENRLHTASNFLSAYVASELSHEKTLAEARLSGPVVTQEQFDEFAQDFQFGPSLLLNSRGQVLNVIPRKLSLLGVDIAPNYSHLTIAETGRANVSRVVSSAVQHLAVVAFAVPFSTPQGRRVMSGTLQIASGPLGDFLKSLHSIHGSVVYLADTHNRIIVSAPNNSSRYQLSTAMSSLAPNSHLLRSGAFDLDVMIYGTPWKLLATVPTSDLYKPINGSTRGTTWLLLLGFMLIASLLGFILLRGWERKLEEVDEAGVDSLTGMANRRQFDLRTAALYSASRRHHIVMAVLVVDVDHFKSINDRFGHQAGDNVLQVVANCVRTCLRTEDVGARWGGDEFVLVLPYVGLASAIHVAERLRNTVAAATFNEESGAPTRVTVSIGVAAEVEDVDPSELLALADIALYWAKERGRNRVERFVAQSTSDIL